MEELVGFLAMAVQFLSLRKDCFKIEHFFTNTVHSWQVVALPLKSQLGGSFSMALGDIIHVLGRPRCGLCCVKTSLLDGVIDGEIPDLIHFSNDYFYCLIMLINLFQDS